MSFDIFFHPRRQSNEEFDRKRPLTGKSVMVRPVVPLTAGELDSVKKLLDASIAEGPPESGCHVLKFADGGGAEIYTDRLAPSDCMVAVRGLTPDLLRFLFAMLEAADWVMMPAMEGNPVITRTAVSAECVSADSPRVVCSSPEELGVVLTKGVEAWQQYRDQVTGPG
jgi:hypothetical protein